MLCVVRKCWSSRDFGMRELQFQLRIRMLGFGRVVILFSYRKVGGVLGFFAPLE